MGDKKRLSKSIAGTIADYRIGEIAPRAPELVETWVQQFDVAVREPLLTEMDHILKQTYITKKTVEEFLTSLISHEKIAGDDPFAFWKNVEFMDIQSRGNSQHEMLGMFDELLRSECDLGIASCGLDDPEAYLYLDDGIFTGNHIRNDLRSWVQADAPARAKVHVVTIASHNLGQWYAKKGIHEAAKSEGKQIDVTWWCCVQIEDRKSFINSSDVLRPTSLPDDELADEYVESLRYPPILRKPGNVGKKKFFSSEEGRSLVEQELLKAGLRIRDDCPYLNRYQRPLGNMVLDSLGFGSLFVTFRNCPNNCPLALWVGDPWFPLFPRKTN